MHNVLRHTKLFAKLSLTIALVCSSSFADTNYRSKWGLDVRGMKLNRQTGVGWLAGGRMAYYLGVSNVHVGLAGMYGTPTGDDPKVETFYYGGAAMGYDGRMSKYFIYELNLLAGYGAGSLKNLGISERSFFFVEPSLGFGVALGGGWRLTTMASYMHTTRAPNLAGMTFGFRFDYRTSTQIKEIND